MSNLKRLWEDYGQAVWLDFIRRDLLSGGGLARLVEADGVRGVTSNPSIFQQAIAASREYDGAIEALIAERPTVTAAELYESLAMADIRAAADILRPVYEGSSGSDGFVSLEVSPRLARDAAATVVEARRLWREVARPNLMVKVPATDECIPAIETLLAEGVNVNATLIFSLRHYEAVAAAYLRGVARAAQPSRVASVASFFVSRLDTVVDAELERRGTEEALALRGRAAIANALRAFDRFRELFHGAPFAPLASRGAHVQRPLWASTSTKNPAYRDVLYFEELVGPETVNTIPLPTLEAFRDHGRPRPSLAAGAAAAEPTVARLAALGIDLASVGERLQVDGVAAFAASFDALLGALAVRAGRSSAPDA
jgi:transaldolase